MMSPSPTAWPSADGIEAALRAAFAPTRLEVIDESAAHAGANGLSRGTHFRVRIAAPALTGLPRVAAHRLVYDALQPAFAAGLHALAIEVLRD
ncbi:DNA-binding transcriptional regulator BolA [Tepidimonas thermarum]|uniref:DNA-binding transcriptional regulator BolA n=1 Tax=Tepidimonas thermarum TaxID=335431 RepID=A0A554X941_9BURK|nr:BolA family protein [Tepidimonas thermarum]TSE32352.1 DNA-binding transcriptional regulator BolA [Tepidimonas thermarum]